MSVYNNKEVTKNVYCKEFIFFLFFDVRSFELLTGNVMDS